MIEARLRFAAAQLNEAERCAREAINRFRATGDLWGEAEVYDQIPAALWLGRPVEAEPLLRDLLVRAERVGHRNVVWICRTLTASMLTARGDLEAAEQAERQSFEFGRSFCGGWCFMSTVVLGIIAHYRGRLDEALEWFHRGLGLEPRSFMLGLLDGALFWTLAAKGDSSADAVLEKARVYMPVPGRQLTYGACGCLGFVIEGLAWLGRYEEAASLQAHAEYVVANGPLCGHSFQQFRTSAGIAAACARNWPRAEEHHQAAIYQADTAPYRIAQPVARDWYAEMLKARDGPGDRDRARALLQEALRMYESMSMLWHARRTGARLSAP